MGVWSNRNKRPQIRLRCGLQPTALCSAGLKRYGFRMDLGQQAGGPQILARLIETATSKRPKVDGPRQSYCLNVGSEIAPSAFLVIELKLLAVLLFENRFQALKVGR